MRNRLMASVTAALSLFAVGHASGADLGRRPVYTAPPPVLAPAPIFLWTGCYVGGNIGGAWAHKDFSFGAEDEGGHSPGGFAGGGQLGCDYQFGFGKGYGPGSWVVGIQGMFDGTSISGNNLDPNNDGDLYSSRVHWFGTLTGRLGFLATPTLLVYGKGGVAWVGDNHTFTNVLNGSAATTENITRTGWDAGLGMEWMFAPNWSVWVEYDHMGFGTKDLTFTFPDGDFFSEHVKQSVDKVLVGVNWRFNFGKGPAAPVVARY